MPLFLLALFISAFSNCTVFSNDCTKASTNSTILSSSLSSEEKKELETFFRLLFRESAFPYTVFGDKPLSFYDYLTELLVPGTMMPIDPWYIHLPERNYLFYEKYKDFFRSNRYLIVDQPFFSKKFPMSGLTHDFLIINKCAFLQIVNQHLTLFKERLGSDVSGETLWKEFQSGRFILCDVLKEDELLWGILLGFGRHNSQLYIQNDDHIDAFDRKLFIDQIPLPAFHCDLCHTETEELKKSYEIYQSPDFLDIVLRRLQE